MPIVFAFHHIPIISTSTCELVRRHYHDADEEPCNLLAKLNLSHMVDDESKLHIGECKVECPDLEAVLVESLDGDGGP